MPKPRFIGVTCPDGRGDDGTIVAVRTLPADAAVGLLSRERSTLRGTLGGGGGGAELRAFASEAAVGANRPDEDRGATGADAPAAAAAMFLDGVFGLEDGVFGLRGAIADGVGDLARLRRRVEGALRDPGPFDGVRGVGVLGGVGRAFVVGGRVPAEEEDFEGDEGVLAGLDGGADGRDVEAVARGLIAVAGAVAGTWADMSFDVGPSP
jgi:hypothetical protein